MKYQLFCLALVLSGVNLLTIDEEIEQALHLNHPEGRAAGKNGKEIYVDGGRAILTELDIAVPVHCGDLDTPCEAEELDRKKRNVASSAVKWSSKTIAYTINEADYTQTELNNIYGGLMDYERYTCVRFVKRTSETRYIQVIRDGGCWSYVGYVHSRNPQPLSLVRGCAWTKGTPIHEFLHALGVKHQQSRSDRDDHVTINWDNIQDGKESNFYKSNTYLFGIPYSYESVMHYGKTAFAIDESINTITTLDPTKQNVIGNRRTFAFEDIQVVNTWMECDSNCPQQNPCTPQQYRGEDCKCYCKNYDLDVPAVECAPAGCVTPEVDCQCSTKGPDACGNIPNSGCDSQSNECKCFPGYTKNGDVCERDCNPSFVSNGYEVSPFTNSPGASSSFQPVQGSEPNPNEVFGVYQNGYYLEASGVGNGQAVLYVPNINRNGEQRLCISFHYRLVGAKLILQYRTSPSGSFTKLFKAKRRGTKDWTAEEIQLTVTDLDTLEMKFKASRHPKLRNQLWKVGLDPLVIRCC